MRFNKAWDTYEKVVKEYYVWKPREVNFDGVDFNEARTDVVGQNGNDGLHYEWKHGAGKSTEEIKDE
jgi:hypothetical protein